MRHTLTYLDVSELIDCEETYIILRISRQIHKHSHYLQEKLCSEFWSRPRVWYLLFDYMKSKKMDEQSQLV